MEAVRASDPGRLADYIEGLFAPEDDVLRQLRRAIPEAGLPEILVSAELGRLLQVLLACIGARRVLEVGTLGGYSAIWMARALPGDGSLLTIEIDPERAAFARGFIRRAGLEERIELRVGDAHDVLRSLEHEGARFDACFIDAEKEGYADYFERALELVRPGGLILADNVLWGGRVLEPADDDADTTALRAFNERIAREPRLRAATILPVRDGLAVCVRR